MHRPQFRHAVLVVAALAGCAGTSAPSLAHNDVPGAPRGSEQETTRNAADMGDLGPIPVTAADPVRGDRLAPVTIVAFSDFQCPFCVRAAGTIADLQREYGPDKVRVVFKHFPLPFHPMARPAADAGANLFLRAGNESFWRYHDALFTSTRPLDKNVIAGAVAGAGGAPGELEHVPHGGGAAALKVDDDLALGRALGVNGTPTFFINGVLMAGAQPIESFRTAVDTELARARAALASGIPADRLYVELTKKGFVPPPKDTLSGVVEDRTVYRVPVGDSPALGPATALVTIVEFSDYQCPYCFRANDTMRDLHDRYGDQIRIVWKDEPLPFHKRAEPAAELALEARAQKGEAAFWSTHDLLMQQKGHLDDDKLAELAQGVGLDVTAAMASVKQHKYLARIEADSDLADDVGAAGTPTFFINGHKVVGAQPIERFAAVIDEQITAARAVLAKGVDPTKLYDALQEHASTIQLDKVTVPAPTAANPSRGPEDAKIVVQIFSDYECPFCKRVEPTLADLEAAFPGQIRVVWRNHPLPFHSHAEMAAEAAMEAYTQKGADAFWKMHDQLMQAKGEGMGRAAIEGYASSLGLDMDKFRDALDHKTHAAEIAADMKIAADAGLPGTPACVINGLKVSGAQPLARFKKAVRQALGEAKAEPKPEMKAEPKPETK